MNELEFKRFQQQTKKLTQAQREQLLNLLQCNKSEGNPPQPLIDEEEMAMIFEQFSAQRTDNY